MILIRAQSAPGSRHLIARFRHNAVRQSIWEDTLPKVRSIMCPWMTWKSYEMDPMLILPNGSEIWFSGLDEAERVEKILGTEYATIFLNEVSQIKRPAVTMVRTRLAQKVFAPAIDGYLQPKMYYDLNPPGTGHWSYLEFFKRIDPDTKIPLRNPEDFRAMYVHPKDNIDNLPPEFILSLQDLPERQKKRFWDGVYSAEVEGALWTLESIEQAKIDPNEKPDMKRVVVAVDPSGAAGKEGERSDEVGIIAAGKGTDNRGYMLGDHTLKLAGPDTWGRKVVQAFIDHQADIVVGETNYGGDMVRFVVQKAAEAMCVTVPFKKITATRGKIVRAEPVAALHEQDKIRFVGTFSELEEQMLNMSTSGYQGSKSPDRLDSYVWAMTELQVRTRPLWMDAMDQPLGEIALYQQ